MTDPVSVQAAVAWCFEAAGFFFAIGCVAFALAYWTAAR